MVLNVASLSPFYFAHAPVLLTADTREAGYSDEYALTTYALNGSVSAGDTVKVGTTVFTAATEYLGPGTFAFLTRGQALADALNNHPDLNNLYFSWYSPGTDLVYVQALQAGAAYNLPVTGPSESTALASDSVLVRSGQTASPSWTEPGTSVCMELLACSNPTFGLVNGETADLFRPVALLTKNASPKGLYTFNVGAVLRRLVTPLRPSGSEWETDAAHFAAFLIRAYTGRNVPLAGRFFVSEQGPCTVLAGMPETGFTVSDYLCTDAGQTVQPLHATGLCLPVVPGQAHSGLAFALLNTDGAFGGAATLRCRLRLLNALGEELSSQTVTEFLLASDSPGGVYYTGAWTYLLPDATAAQPSAAIAELCVLTDADFPVTLPESGLYPLIAADRPLNAVFAFLNAQGGYEFMPFCGAASETLTRQANYTQTGSPENAVIGPVLREGVYSEVHESGVYYSSIVSAACFKRLKSLFTSPVLYRVSNTDGGYTYQACELLRHSYQAGPETDLYSLKLEIKITEPEPALNLR